MLTGQNGILNRASEAKNLNGIAQNGELVKLSAMDALSQGLGTITDANLKTALNSNIGEGKYEITGDATNGWTVTVDGKDYRVEATGIVNGNGSSTGSVNWDKILEDANKNPESMKHEDQVKSSLIGIGTDGKPVNMDLWNPTYYEYNKTWKLTGNDNCYHTIDVYVGDITEDGKIIGKIPQYIWNSETNEFKPVTSMTVTFFGYENLIESPEIPSTVNEMNGTFYGCTKLKVAPEIPSSVIDMYRTFLGCTGLTTAPKIPNSVTSIYDTFSGCTGLTTAPEIPNSVTRMYCTFSGCTNLTGEITINANLNSSEEWTYEDCFSDTTKPIQLTGTCPILSKLAETSSNGNVTVK